MQATHRHQRIYRHYKGQYYRVLCEAHHSESGERVVVYQQLYRSDRAAGSVWVRPACMFYGREREWVAGQFTPSRQRFERVHRVPRAIARLLRKLEKQCCE